jgi:RsiW-degrading membrane proteinase PrsW (M82 family)
MRLVLTVEGGVHDGRVHLLESGRLEIGRADACHVRFEAGDACVSRHHATVSLDGEGYRLFDHSANGTFIDGRRVSATLLRDGDLVQFGRDGPCLRARVESLSEAPVAQELVLPQVETSIRPSLADRGLYDPAHDKGRRTSVLSLSVVLGMTGIGAFFGLLTVLLTFFELGPGAAFAGVFVAFLAAPVYVSIWLWLDRYDPEPAWVLAGALVWGAGAATFVSGLANSLFTATMTSLTQNPGLSHFLSASISAPFVEEATKGLGVLLIFLFLRREFDGVLDGIVYAGIVALGFATVENVLYYGRVVAKEGAGGLILVFVLRGVLGPFGHAVFTSMTGIGCGLARQSHSGAVRIVMPLVGYAGAVLLHFLWNTLAAFSGSVAGFLVVYIVIWAPLFLVFFALVIWMGFREAVLMRHMLGLEVARGLLTDDQADLVSSWLRRIRWLWSALGDSRLLRARRAFLHAATRLALCYWHASRAAAAGGQTLSFAQIPLFQRDIQRLRAEI